MTTPDDDEVRLMAFPRGSPENPYIGLLYRHLAQAGIDVLPDQRYWSRRLRGLPGPPPHLLHWHWPARRYTHLGNPWLSPAVAARFFANLGAQRRAGARVVWTFHNAMPHEGAWPAFDRAARAQMVEMSDLILVHFAAARDLLARQYRRLDRVVMSPHGSYRGWVPDHGDRARGRQRVGVPTDAFAYLVFGDLRAYKNVDMVLDAFSDLHDADARLIVAGRAKDPRTLARLHARAALDPRVLVRAGDIPDDALQDYYRAADVAVIGRPAFSTGSGVLALDFDLPIIGPRENHLAELATGPALIPIAEVSRDGIADALRRARTVDIAAARAAARASSLTRGWGPIAAALADTLRVLSST